VCPYWKSQFVHLGCCCWPDLDLSMAAAHCTGRGPAWTLLDAPQEEALSAQRSVAYIACQDITDAVRPARNICCQSVTKGVTHSSSTKYTWEMTK
jgi:hypothetical protein